MQKGGEKINSTNKDISIEVIRMISGKRSASDEEKINAWKTKN